jgi:hypothetical protein
MLGMTSMLEVLPLLAIDRYVRTWVTVSVWDRTVLMTPTLEASMALGHHDHCKGCMRASRGNWVLGREVELWCTCWVEVEVFNASRNSLHVTGTMTAQFLREWG